MGTRDWRARGNARAARLATATAEVKTSRALLSQLLDGDPVTTMSFPHGSYDEASLAVARQEYEVVYVSDGDLNGTEDGGRLTSPVLARVGVVGPEVTNGQGQLTPELLALSLFRRRVRRPR